MSTPMIAFILYLFTIVDSINNVADGVLWFSVAGLIISLVVVITSAMVEGDACTSARGKEVCIQTRNTITKYIKRAIIPLITVAAFVVILVPSQRDTAIIVGGTLGYKGVETIVSDERFDNLGNSSYEALESWLDHTTRRYQEETESGDESDGSTETDGE